MYDKKLIYQQEKKNHENLGKKKRELGREGGKLLCILSIYI